MANYKYYKRYCDDIENITNYENAAADNFKGWQLHHILETHNSDGERRLVDITASELVKLGMYYNRPSNELIFLTTSEHRQLHMKGKIGYWKDKINPMYGKHHSKETRKKLSQERIGKSLSEETRKKMSEAHKNMSDETKNKIGENSKGRHWYNNGTINKFCYKCPEGFVPGKLQH